MQTIQDILKYDENQFPFVIKTTNEQLNNVFSGESMDKEVDVLLNKRIEIPYAHVRILPVANELKSMSEHGGDWILIYNGFVDEEILIPLQYPGKLKVIPHTQKRPRYTSVSQILENPPRYVRVDEDTISVDSEGNCLPIPAHSRLEIKGVTTHDSNDTNTTYLECIKDDGVECKVCENSHVNFTGLFDNELYTMGELASTLFLPKVIEFQEVSRRDIVEFDQEKADGLSTILEGPLEMLGVKRLDVIAGCVKEKCGHVRTILIPKEIWIQVLVKVMEFKTELEKSTYIKEAFGVCIEPPVFIREKLYFLTNETMEIVWLKNLTCTDCSSSLKKTYCKAHVNTGSIPPPPIPVVQADTSPPPPIPERIPKSSVIELTVTQLPKPHEHIGLRSKIFHKLVNKKHKDNPDEKHKTHPLPLLKSPLNSRRFLKKNAKEKQIADEHDARSTCIHRHEERSLPPIPETESLSNSSNIYDEIDKEDYLQESHEYESIEDANKTSQEPICKKHFYQYGVEKIAKHFRRCGLSELAYLSAEHKIDGPFLKENGLKFLKEDPFLLSEQNFTIVKRITENQDTQPKRFAELTVDEVCECFKTFSLDEMVDVCKEQKIDGAFLASFSLEELKQEPFYLSDDKIKRVRIIVQDYWTVPVKNIDK